MKATAYIETLLVGCALLGVSCSGHDKVSTVSRQEITVSPTTQPVTRAAISGTDMPDGFHIWLSTYLSDETEAVNNRNYFTDVEYAKDVSVWKSATPHYWPLQGTLDFLGIATDPALGISCTWNASRNTSRVDVDVPDTYASQTEVLYAASYPLAGVHASVPMSYYHSQALLIFKTRASTLNLIKVTDITIHDVYTAGTLIVKTDGPLIAEWDYSSAVASDRAVPKPSVDYELEPGDTFLPFGSELLLPEQLNKTFTVTFKQRANTGIAWDSDLVVEQTFTFDDVFRMWQMGKRYTYNIDFTLTGITVTPSIEDWTL